MTWNRRLRLGARVVGVVSVALAALTLRWRWPDLPFQLGMLGAAIGLVTTANLLLVLRSRDLSAAHRAVPWAIAATEAVAVLVLGYAGFMVTVAAP